MRYSVYMPFLFKQGYEMRYRFLAKDELSLYNKTIREHQLNFPPIILDDYMTSHFFVIYKNDPNVPLGYIVLEKKSKDELCILLLYIFPMYRRMRVATQILDTMLYSFKEKIVYGFCPKRNEEAFKFFSTKGKWLSQNDNESICLSVCCSNVETLI